ncbi:unnamed protein product, partial [Mesorhabditis belari]|uniref:Protein SZT2 n=1 Tax=Mesorhabditis belari TaxID=2138241 RepID=A0AAF3F0T5_9BILA
MQSSSEEETPFVSQYGDTDSLRKASEVFIFMHRCFRASRNIRAHWFLDHLNKAVEVPKSDAKPPFVDDKTDKYGKEMEVLGVVAEGGNPDENVEGERFKITMDTKVTYISRFYRHVFVLDLSPFTLVADDRSGACLHMKLLECLRTAMYAVTKSFKIPGTNHIFTPQIWVSVCVFTPFLTFDEDLVLVQGVLLTESNVEDLLETVTKRFYRILTQLHKCAKPVFAAWATKRQKTRCKYDSTCEPSDRFLSESENRPPSKLTVRNLLTRNPRKTTIEQKLPNIFEDEIPLEGVIKYNRHFWKTSKECEGCEEKCESVCDGYIQPEWALIFMLRIGLIAVQMLPENTQSNIVVLTDSVCGMPDAIALHQLLTQLRSYTVSCSFIQIHSGARSEPCFGHVASSELFHFLAMATFGSFLPNCKCCLGDIDKDLNFSSGQSSTAQSPAKRILSERNSTESGKRAARITSNGSIGRRPSEEIPPGICAGAQPGRMNAFHRALVCWCFQNALQENQHIQNLANDINPEFAQLYSQDQVRKPYLELFYTTTLPELLYVRLREGYTLKNTSLDEDGTTLRVHLTLPFRPSVFIDYVIYGTFRLDRAQRETVKVEIAIVAPYHVMKDLLTEDGDFVDMSRQKGVTVFRNTLDSLIEADRLLLHLHSFNIFREFYTIPFGISPHFSLFRLIDKERRVVVEMPRGDAHTMTFVDFWRVLCNLDEGVWQKWVHTHCERVLLRVDEVPINIFREGSANEVTCEKSNGALHEFLRNTTSFCLLHKLAYVKFVYGDNSEVPKYFYMIRICSEPPAVTIKMAFLGGISSSDRRQIADEFRRDLIKLRLKTRTHSKENQPPKEPIEALSVIRRPVERVLIRYRNVPMNLRAMVRLSEESGRGETIRHLILHNSLTKYLSSRRRIWNLPCVFEQNGITGSSKEHATFIAHTLLHRRLNEGFHIAWAENGIVGLCKQVVTPAGFALEQYIYFPPQNLYLPFRVNRKRLPSTCKTIEPEEEEDYGIVFESEEKEEKKEKEPITYQLIGEYWSEPIADYENEEPRLVSSRDDDLISVLFTLDQLIKWCQEGRGGQSTIRITSRGKDPAKMLSGCVSVAVQPFSIGDLLENAEKRLLILPLFDNDRPEGEKRSHERMRLLLTAILKELEGSTDCYVDVEDSELWNRIMRQADEKSTGNRSSRVFLHRLNPWTMMAIMAPQETEELFVQGGVPLLFCLCDEPSLAYRLTQKDEKPKMTVEDLRLRDEVWKFGEERVLNPPNQFVWATRCSDLQKGLYKPTSFGKYVTKVRDEACGRATLFAMYQALNKEMEVSSDTVQYVLEGFCDYMKIEIPRVSEALEKFCAHLHHLSKDDPRHNQVNLEESCYTGTDFESLFANAVEQNFKPIQTLPSYYIYQKKGRDRKITTQSDRSPLPFTGIDATSGDKTPDESEHSSLIRASSGPPIRRRARGMYGSEIPLFLYFSCSIHFPDGSMTSFPVQHLPYCLHELVAKCPEKPSTPFNVADVKVNVDLYVLSWPIEDEDEHLTSRWSTSDDKEKSYAKRRMQAFRDALPKPEQEVIKRLLRNVQRLIEMEMVLTDSRRQTVTLGKLQKISDFISKELKDNGADKRIDQKQRTVHLVINKPGIMDELKKRLNGITAEYCNLKRIDDSDMFYCVPFEEPSTVERRSRNESRRASTTNLNSNRSRQVSGDPTIESNTNKHPSPLRDRNASSGNSLSIEAANPPMTLLRHREKSDAFADFWLILSVSDVLLFQLCRRHTDRHERLFDLMWRKVKQTLRILNQEMLLEKTLLTREVDSLLLSPPDSGRFVSGSKANQHVSDDDFEGDEGRHAPVTDNARFQYEPGHFACEMKHEKWFSLHPRVRSSRLTNFSGINSVVQMNTGMDALKRELDPFLVKNRNLPYVYVLSDRHQHVFYLQLHNSMETLMHTMINGRKSWKKRAYHRLEKQDEVLLSVHGVYEPDQDFIESFINKLQKRLDNTTLDHLVMMLGKNAHIRLEPADVQFIQKDPRYPNATFHFAIPAALEAHLQAIYVYFHQQLYTVDIHSAKYKDESGARAMPTLFRPLPPPNQIPIPRDYQPQFKLSIRPMKEGNRTTGIACLEFRFVNEKREILSPRSGRLNNSTHISLMLPTESDAIRLQHYKNLTTIERVKEVEKREGICAFAEVAVWQAGDVGLEELENKLAGCLRMAVCDVMTEYGLLNDTIIELEQAPVLPMSPIAHQSIQTPLSGQKSRERALLIRQRSSSEAQTPSTGQPPPLLTPVSSQKYTLATIDQKHQSHFSFDLRPSGSVASDLDKMNGSMKEDAPREEVLSQDFLRCAESWWNLAITQAPLATPSLSKIEIDYDSAETPKRALEMVQETVENCLKAVISEFKERVLVAEYRETDQRDTSNKRYEIHRNRAHIHSSLVYDVGMEINSDQQPAPDFLMLTVVKEIAEETMRYGFEPEGDPPEVLKVLAKEGAREMFVPEMTDLGKSYDRVSSAENRSAFVPRRRLFYAIFRANKLTVFLYNFKPDLARQISAQITRLTHWHNAKSRLIREIALHKTGFQHFSDNIYKNTDNPYIEQLWKQPEEVLAEEMSKRVSFHSRTSNINRSHNAPILDRIYRQINPAFLARNQYPCMWRDQIEQFKTLRQDILTRLEGDNLFHQIHKQFLENNYRVTEENLSQLIEASKVVHFVLTPILFSPHGSEEEVEREVHATMTQPASLRMMGDRKASGVSLVNDELGAGMGTRTRSYTLSGRSQKEHRARSSTMSVPASASKDDLDLPSLSNDLSESWNIHILYRLLKEYVDFLKKIHGVEIIAVTSPGSIASTRRAYQLNYEEKKTVHPPEIWLCKGISGGIILLHLHFQSPYFVLDMHTWEDTPICFKAEN